MARKRLPLLVLAALVTLGAAYFILYVGPRQDELVELDFRRLAAMTERIDMQLDTYRKVVANATKPPYAMPAPLVRVDKAPKPEEAEAEDVEITSNGRWFELRAGTLKARLRVEELVRPAFEQDPETFDKLILATSDGQILHQEGRKDIQLTTLTGLGIDQGKIPLLSRSTGLEEGNVSGRSYKIFVRPCSTPRGRLAAGRGAPEGWVVWALMASPQFHLRALQVSANWIILFVGVALLVLLALPFVKLLTIGEGARLRAIDGLLAGLCALIGLSVLTVLLLDLFVFKKLELKADEQLKNIAAKIRTSFLEELGATLATFAEVSKEARRSRQAYGSHNEAPAEMAEHTNFFWADENGEQIFKWTRKDEETPLISVRDRAYFRDALAGRYAFRPAGSGPAHRFALESVRSWTTGRDEVNIAMEDRGGTVLRDDGLELRSAVAALSTRMRSVHEAVLPQGFGFAVIDTAGKVLFHSDRRRMLQENFLEEAESQKLRALASAKRAGSDQVHYKGHRHKVYLEPVPELSWSVLAFREMAVLRATNVQIVTTALVCLVFYAALFFFLFSAVYMASSTRARWLWPMASRRGAYLQLAVFYVGCLIAHVELLREGDPVFLLVTGMLIPLLVLFVSYIKVRSVDKLLDGKQRAAIALVLMLLAICVVAGKDLHQEARTFALSSLVLGGLFLFLPPVTRLLGRWRTAPLRVLYLSTAALLLMALTVLPAASFFKLACDVPIENMVKRVQLTLMPALEDQSPQNDSAKDYAEIFFATKSEDLPEKRAQSDKYHFQVPRLLERLEGVFRFADAFFGMNPAVPKEKPYKNPHVPWLLERLEDIFPVYNESSRALARLSPDSVPEWRSLYWKHQEELLWLHRHAGPGTKRLHLRSTFPALRPQGTEWLRLGSGVLGLGLISLALVWLMAHNLMLLGASSPLWLNRRKLCLGPSVGPLVYVSSRPGRLHIPVRSDAAILDLAAAEKELEAGRALDSPAFTGRRLIVVKGFEHRIEDRSFNWAKLELLEALACDGRRRVVLLSTQDPYLCLASGFLCGGGDDPDREQKERARWGRLLARFSVVDLDGRPHDAKKLRERLQRIRKRLRARGGRLRLERIPWCLHVERCLQIIDEECSPTLRLQEIGLELLRSLHLGKTSRGELRKEILAQAERYYADLWCFLPEDEKLVLLQLAEEGLANPRNLRPLEKLIARGLVRRDPAPQVMNETFRLFVIGRAAREGVHQIEARREQESTWGQLRMPLTAALLGCVFFFGSTQQEMLKTTLSLMTVVAGALPHLLQLVGYLGAKAPVLPGR